MDAHRCSDAIAAPAARRARRLLPALSLLVPLALLLLGSLPARAEAPAVAPAATAVSAGTPAAAPAPAPPPAPPYSLPWQLRPVGAATALRSDTSVAFYEDAAGNRGTTTATMLLASYKVTPSLAPMIRLGFVQNAAPGATPDGTSLVNPIVGLTYGRRMGSWRAAGFLGGTLPVGQGGGDAPDPGAAAANGAGVSARSGMDNAMFAVNYFTGIAGADLAYVDHKLTVQAEVTVLQLLRVRGEDTAAATDGARTNSTAGLHVGYFLLPQLSLGGELRYQRWLSTPTRLVMGNRGDIPDANKDTVTFAVGPRAHFAFGKGVWFRPGVSYARGLDNPLKAGSYNMVQVDLPVVF